MLDLMKSFLTVWNAPMGEEDLGEINLNLSKIAESIRNNFQTSFFFKNIPKSSY